MSRLLRPLWFFVWSAALAPLLSGQVTESPETVKPGKFLLEMDGLSLTFDRDRSAGERFEAIGIASALIMTGITDDLDVQVGLDCFRRETYVSSGTRDSRSGLGDLTLRAKYTVWRARDGGAAAAVIPYVKAPTSNGGLGNDAVEGGLIVPWSTQTAGGFVPGAMLVCDIVRNDADDGYESQWALTAYVEREVLQGITAYAELIFQTDPGTASRAAGEAGAGARSRLGEHIELDYQILRGLNGRASDWTHVLRVNWEW
ncbi:MAG TPA: transporter [Opitutus sp.]|nr:transporter [Opitutus sp.]